ncbi:MAG: hypothetical protein EGS63_10700, partial [Lachnospira sp.]|nr:hypothetical protein [Lachnospira sp.]
MKTAIVGYPRIGAHRELKFASEQYFRGACTETELQETAKALRLANLTQQKESGLDWIPSNDFSFYDGMLDTAFLLNAVPKRYRELGLAPLDTYFAAARGYQGDKGDVKALAMKKWFNTNYHYIVPEVEDDTKICLLNDKLWEEYELTPNSIEEYEKPKNVSETKEQVNNLRTQMREMGSVNVESINEYKKQK